MRALWHKLQSRFRQRQDSEHEQALVRMVIAMLILVYLFGEFAVTSVSARESGLLWACCALLLETILGLGLVLAIAIHPAPSNTRRIMTILRGLGKKLPCILPSQARIPYAEI